ncbi:hypothetical protein HPP92_016507 [Vanilla planifolia]|uniref:Uncharacterized protein n=1 Tax=Vanilla planifolia TaxID=51239 RepID=A0A835UQ24_VANPL|nr:hypothetical protein HPP92_016507 [Vanilla planifolia]
MDPLQVAGGASATPMIRWNLECAERSGKLTPEVGDRTFRKGKNALGRTVETLSARKIAAGIWHLQLKRLLSAKVVEGRLLELT